MCKYVDQADWLPCHGHQEASRCQTKGESEEFIANRQWSAQAMDPPWLETQGGHPKQGMSGPLKRTDVFQNFKKYKGIYYKYLVILTKNFQIYEKYSYLSFEQWKKINCNMEDNTLSV